MTPLFQTAIPFCEGIDLPDIARRLGGRSSRKLLGYLREIAQEIVQWPVAAYSVTTRNCNIVRGRVNEHGMFVADPLGYDAMVITPLLIFVWRGIFNVELLPALQTVL